MLVHSPQSTVHSQNGFSFGLRTFSFGPLTACYPLSACLPVGKAIRYQLLRNVYYFSPLTDYCLLSTDYSQTEFALC